jgi:hypothetical protein
MKLFALYLFLFTIMFEMGKCNFYFRILFNDTVSTAVASYNVFAQAKRKY